MKKIIRSKTLMYLAGLFLLSACSGPMVREYVKPSKEGDQFLKIKTVAVFPFDNFTSTKDAEKAIESLLIPALYHEEVFEDVVDPRFVRDAMKKLKIVTTDILDREQVKKLGDELAIQGIIIGKVVTYGRGKEKEAANEVSIEMALVEVASGATLWTGNVTSSGSLTVGKVFGVTPGESDIVVARKAVTSIVEEMADSIEDAREREREGIVEDLKEKELAEEKRLKELQQQTNEIEKKIEQADAEAKKIKQDAMTEADSIKANAEMEKAAIDAEKSQIESEKEALEEQKLKLESERVKLEEEQAKLEELRKERGELEEQIQKLQQEIKEETVGDAEKRVEEIEKLEQDQKSLQGEIEGKQEEVKSLEEQLEQVEKKAE